MSGACLRIEGKRIDTKLAMGWANDMDSRIRAEDAAKGSLMLCQAILRAKGYPVAEPEVIAAMPVFKERPVRPRGRPKRDRKVRRINPKIIRIQGIIATHFDKRIDDIISCSKGRKFCRPRQIAIYLARKTTSASLNDIGFHFDNLDHTTVIHAVREVGKRAEGGDEDTIKALRAAHSAGIR